VCIGSDRARGYDLAKMQLFRTLDDVNPVPELAKLEDDIMREANRIGVGAMGFGGRVSLIGCKIAAANRLPASFFVSVAYDCWAFRRLGVRLDAASGAITGWLYRDPNRPVERMAKSAGFPLSGREVVLRAPLSEETVRALKVGDVVLISGEMYTGRDQVHAYLMKHEPPVDLHGAVLYHCGPVMLKEGEEWKVKAAGPTTSSREEPYEATVIERYGVRAVIGKGGMGAKTLAALKKCGAVYFERYWRRGAVLCADRGEGAGRPSHGLRHSGSDVAPPRARLCGHRHDGRARQQPARGRGAGDRRGSGCARTPVGNAAILCGQVRPRPGREWIN